MPDYSVTYETRSGLVRSTSYRTPYTALREARVLVRASEVVHVVVEAWDVFEWLGTLHEWVSPANQADASEQSFPETDETDAETDTFIRIEPLTCGEADETDKTDTFREKGPREPFPPARE